MRRRFTLLCLLVACLFSSSAVAQQLRTVSKKEALFVAGLRFYDQDVDYYLCEDAVLKVKSGKHNLTISQKETWTFFVDADPMKGWEHDCYLVCVPRKAETSLPPSSKLFKFRLPPRGNFSPLLVKNRYGAWANLKPRVKRAALTNDAKRAAEHTYAVILSGGISKVSNKERYWNDCSFVYQTLVNKYGVPKDNISVVMSDGTDPADDIQIGEGVFKSSPLDLDYDGKPDIEYAATRANVKKVLSDLSRKMQKDDHLFFYVIDHGGSIDEKNQSYICLWDWESLQDYELADWLRPFIEKSIYINAVLGQCYSGGFVKELTEIGCVVATASEGDKPSYACGRIPFDEFVYQWTSAINEKDAFDHDVLSDEDHNGRVTMDEAFRYAKQHDRAPEVPQYNSKPISVGEDLAFNNLPKAVDLYIKDNAKDTGKEPNLTTEIFWDSPDIWVRNKADGIEKHENPCFSEDHPYAFVYVRVYNRGKEDYNGGKYLHMYWALASTGLTPKAWRGQEYYVNQEVTGGRMNPAHIKSIKAGESRIVRVTWPMPDGVSPKDNGTERHHFCLLGQIYDDGDPELKGDYVAVSSDNDIAQKNVSIIVKEELSKETSVFLRNIYKDNRSYSLSIQPRTPADRALLSKAKLQMEMAQPIYDAWKRGGLHAKSITYPSSINPQKVVFNSWDARLEDIRMHGANFDKVKMNVDFKSPATYPGESYTFDLLQKDEHGNIVGGETFVVEAPLSIRKSLGITPIDLGNGKYELSTELEDRDYSFRWTDSDGNDIGAENRVTVTPSLKNNGFSVTAISSQGEMAQGSITLESKTGLKSIAPTSVEDFMDVELHNPVESRNAVLQVSSLTQIGGVLLSEPLSVDTKKMRLDVTSLPSGIYVLIYSVDGQIVDSRKFSKK